MSEKNLPQKQAKTLTQIHTNGKIQTQKNINKLHQYIEMKLYSITYVYKFRTNLHIYDNNLHANTHQYTVTVSPSHTYLVVYLYL